LYNIKILVFFKSSVTYDVCTIGCTVSVETHNLQQKLASSDGCGGSYPLCCLSARLSHPNQQEQEPVNTSVSPKQLYIIWQQISFLCL